MVGIFVYTEFSSQKVYVRNPMSSMMLCLDLAEEFGYACVRDAFGNVYGDYGDVIQAVEDGVI